ncbi:hypothetical protein J5N97_011834 [Dioscorea zingiberensis]|uniref:Major facilitator superfamily (MFS) profile domain-containing protein n=1 Tax=Dioscorea zingiberensis TaxID=325984 RepID=A0A9D5D2R3_9LILI|nr:hypothetical protein J5N97_011834 [Dioscorea zingiberensis]
MARRRSASARIPSSPSMPVASASSPSSILSSAPEVTSSAKNASSSASFLKRRTSRASRSFITCKQEKEEEDEKLVLKKASELEAFDQQNHGVVPQFSDKNHISDKNGFHGANSVRVTSYEEEALSNMKAFWLPSATPEAPVKLDAPSALAEEIVAPRLLTSCSKQGTIGVMIDWLQLMGFPCRRTMIVWLAEWPRPFSRRSPDSRRETRTWRTEGKARTKRPKSLENNFICPSCKVTLTNALTLMAVSTCGHVFCKKCSDRFLAVDKVCLVCNKECKERHLVVLEKGGTGFAGHGDHLQASDFKHLGSGSGLGLIVVLVPYRGRLQPLHKRTGRVNRKLKHRAPNPLASTSLSVSGEGVSASGHTRPFAVPGLLMALVGLTVFLFLTVNPVAMGVEKEDDLCKPSEKNGVSDPLLEGGIDVKEKPVGFFKAWRIPGVAPFAFCLFFSKLVAYTFLYWLPFYLSQTVIDGKHLSDSTSGLLSTLFDVGGVVGGILAGHISDRLNARALTAATFMYCAIPALLLYRIFGGVSLFWNVILMLITGIFVNGPYALITTAVSADLGTHSSLNGNSRALATVTAIIDGTGSVGAAIGPLLTGYLSAKSWSAVFIMLMLSAFVAGLLLTRLVVAEVTEKRDRRSLLPNTCPSSPIAEEEV